MANNRVAIRAAAQTLLSGHTDAGTSVYTNRESKEWQSELPSIIIFTPEESSEPANIQATRYNRTMTMNIEVRVQADSSTDDVSDALLAEIETIILGTPSLSGTVQSTTLLKTETKIDSSGEKDIGVGTLVFQCRYSS